MEDAKKYICKLPTNGHQVGDEVMLTDDEVANFNGGEAEPRFVLAEDHVEPEVVPAPEPVSHEVPAAGPVDAPVVADPGVTTQDAPAVGDEVTQAAAQQ